MSALDQLLMNEYRNSVKDPPPRLQGAPSPLATKEHPVADVAEAETPSHATVEVPDGAVPGNESVTAVSAGHGTVTELAAADTAAAEAVDTAAAEFEPAEPLPATLESFRPQWEVDRFRWPEMTDRIDAKLESELDDALARLRSQCDSTTKTLLVSSTDRGVGRTTLTLCLARRAANSGLSVAVVDLDHQNPTIMESLGVMVDAGVESLEGEETPESICVTAVNDGVSVLPMTVPMESPWNSAVEAMLETLQRHFDLVLVDTAPNVQPPTTSVPIGLIIVDDANTPAAKTQQLADQMKKHNVWTAGLMRNFAA